MLEVTILKNGESVSKMIVESQEELDSVMAYHNQRQTFGKPAQTIQQEVELSPAVFDEEGNELSPAVMEMQEMHIPGSYEVEVLDISAELAQQAINAEAQAFLASTDWMVIRAAERGEELSPEFKAERQAARDRIVK